MENMHINTSYHDDEFRIISNLSNLWSSKNNLSENIERDNFGFFMSTIIREFGPIFYINQNNLNKIIELVNNSKYREEILLFCEICSITGFEPSYLLFATNFNNSIRNDINDEFFRITKNKKFWSILEENLDAVISNRKFQSFKQIYMNRCLILLNRAKNDFIINGQIEKNCPGSYLIRQLKKGYLS